MSDLSEETIKWFRDRNIPITRQDTEDGPVLRLWDTLPAIENTPNIPQKDVTFRGRLERTMTPSELCQAEMGYVPDKLPETWDEMHAAIARRIPGYKPGDMLYIKSSAFGSALDPLMKKSE